MPSTIHLKRKIRSIGNTRQITKAMQMVAASKMRRAQEAVLGTRAYSQAGYEVMRRLRDYAAKEQHLTHPLLQARPINHSALVVITSDRGLAGAYNSNVMRKALEFLGSSSALVDVVTIGRKGQEAFARLGIQPVASFTDFPTRPGSNDIVSIAKLTVDGFLEHRYDQVNVVYTKFYSTLRQQPTRQQILPIESASEDESEPGRSSTFYQFEPEPTVVLGYVVPRLVEMQLLQTLLESIASEHSARMLAMRNATDNASELIEDLQLTYNSVRQANITRELSEIIAGAGGV